MFCVECGAELPPHAKFCSACGTPVVVATARASKTTHGEARSDGLPSPLPHRAPVAVPAAGPVGFASFGGRGSDVFSWNGLKATLAFVSILGMPFGMLIVAPDAVRVARAPQPARVSANVSQNIEGMFKNDFA